MNSTLSFDSSNTYLPITEAIYPTARTELSSLPQVTSLPYAPFSYSERHVKKLEAAALHEIHVFYLSNVGSMPPTPEVHEAVMMQHKALTEAADAVDQYQNASEEARAEAFRNSDESLSETQSYWKIDYTQTGGYPDLREDIGEYVEGRLLAANKINASLPDDFHFPGKIDLTNFAIIARSPVPLNRQTILYSDWDELYKDAVKRVFDNRDMLWRSEDIASDVLRKLSQRKLLASRIYTEAYMELIADIITSVSILRSNTFRGTELGSLGRPDTRFEKDMAFWASR